MPAPVVHFEIGCQHIESTKKFYASVFGWEYSPEMPTMGMVTNLGPFASKPTDGIGGHINSLGHPPHTYVTFYVQVDDIPGTLAQIEASGGKTLIPKTEVPGMGHFAWFTDPEGNAIGLWTSMKH
ncbi:MAG: VOC family protein [Planctomycetota bacterium]|nr:VOC family protein [Planctomycetota bacterium]